MNVKILLLVCIVHTVSANGYSQFKKMDINFDNCSLTEVMDFLKTETSCEFLYRKGVVNEKEMVTVDLKEASLQEILDAVFKAKGYDYEIVNNVIVLKKATPTRLEAIQRNMVTVTGTVKDENGRPLPGATVKIKGTSIGTATSGDGKYELSFPRENTITLIYTFVGMKEQEIRYSGQREINVVLQEETSRVDEVIVTGYSVRKASEMTGSVQQFRGEMIARNTSDGKLINALKGHTTGLQITDSQGEPGKDADMLVRGLGTLFAEKTNKNPLIVIDGAITDYTSLEGILSPMDISEITLLKDAASTAIYGSRAATGVLIVSTKRGIPEQMNVDLSIKFGLSTPRFGGLKYMTTSELLEYGKMSLRNWWNGSSSLQAKYSNVEQFMQDTLKVLYNNFDMNQSTDWRDLAYQNGLTTDIGIAIRGGGEKARYYFSYNYYNEEGTRVTYDLTRHQFRGRMDFDLLPMITIGANMNGTFSKNIAPNTSSGESYHPWMTPYNEDGSLKYSIPLWETFVMQASDNANFLQDDKYNNNTTVSSNLFGSFYGAFKPFPWLSFTSTNTFTLLNSNRNDYYDSRTYSGNNSRNYMSKGILEIDENRSWTFLTSNVLRLNFNFGEHHLSGLVGQEWYERHSRTSLVQMYDQMIAGERNIGGFSKQGEKRDPGVIPEGSEKESGSFSVFSEVNYNYNSRYMLSVSFRTDGSTNFGKDNRYGTFYSVGGSWVISEEGFMKRQSLFSLLKLRASYGTSGKEAGMDYLNYTLYRVGMTTFDYYWNHPAYQSTYAAELNQLGNDKLSWETAHNFNIGVDLGFINNRILLSVDAYRRRNSDLIMSVALAAANGVGQQYRNVGEMVNRGFELTLNTHNIHTSNFNWRSTFNLSYNDNELTKLADDRLTRTGYKTFYPGDNVNTLKKVRIDGIDPETGRARYERVEEDGTITIVNTLTEATSGNGELSFVNIGQDRAPIWGGFTNTLNYRNWELYIHTTYAFNYMLYNGVKASFASGRGWLTSNRYKIPSAWKLWKQPGDIADIPIITCDPGFSQDLSSDTSFPYVNANHLKIATIRLSYRLPYEWLHATFLKDVSLNFICDNVHSFTSKKFAGNDPESPSGWVSPRRYTLGINVNF